MPFGFVPPPPADLHQQSDPILPGAMLGEIERVMSSSSEEFFIHARAEVILVMLGDVEAGATLSLMRQPRLVKVLWSVGHGVTSTADKKSIDGFVPPDRAYAQENRS